MPTLLELARTSRSVAKTRSRNEKAERIAAWLRSLAPHERLIGAAYIAGNIPQGKIGVGYAAIKKARLEAVAKESTLELTDLERILSEIKEESGSGSTTRRKRKLGALFSTATEEERVFLVGLLSGSIRQGASEGVLVQGIARAANIEAAFVQRAAMVTGNIAVVAEAALRAGVAALSEFRLQVFRPLAPMLAQPCDSIADVFGTIDDEIALELKMDGARVQAHKSGDEVRLYSRSLRDITDTLPDVVSTVRGLEVESAILDGEAIALRKDGRPERFQTTMSRFASHEPSAEGKLSSFFFDALMIEGDDLLGRTAVDRFNALEQAVPAENRIERILRPTSREAEDFSRSALERGHEGVMAKVLSSVYQAGARGAQWLKVKPVHTLDLVVLGAEWGSGRRKGRLSNLHLGARDPNGGFVMLGKTFKGMTDQILEWQTQELLARETHRDDYTVYVRPELVVEIAFGGVLGSTKYKGGVALRFARLRRYRADKTADQADTIESVRSLF